MNNSKVKHTMLDRIMKSVACAIALGITGVSSGSAYKLAEWGYNDGIIVIVGLFAGLVGLTSIFLVYFALESWDLQLEG